MTANNHRWARATLTADEIASVRGMCDQESTRIVATKLGLNVGTIFRILSGLPVHNLTASQVRSRLRVLQDGV